MKRPLILISNDDGVHANGIRCLARALKGLGRVVVIAPDQPRSAASHSITLHRPLRIFRLSEDVYAVDGTPTDCIMLGVHEVLKGLPELIVSGINHGGNLGDDIHYSGTVSAAYEGSIFGVPSVAVSLVTDNDKEKDDVKMFRYSALFAYKLSRIILKEKLPAGVLLNVNIPNLPARKIKGYAFTCQGKRNYGNVIVEKADPRGRKYYWIGGDLTGFEDIRRSDCNAVREGYVSITPLRVNLTDHAILEKMEGWKI